jgi:hypothetical protein
LRLLSGFLAKRLLQCPDTFSVKYTFSLNHKECHTNTGMEYVEEEIFVVYEVDKTLIGE